MIMTNILRLKNLISLHQKTLLQDSNKQIKQAKMRKERQILIINDVKRCYFKSKLVI